VREGERGFRTRGQSQGNLIDSVGPSAVKLISRVKRHPKGKDGEREDDNSDNVPLAFAMERDYEGGRKVYRYQSYSGKCVKLCHHGRLADR